MTCQKIEKLALFRVPLFFHFYDVFVCELYKQIKRNEEISSLFFFEAIFLRNKGEERMGSNGAEGFFFLEGRRG
jgi:hypothetical protein